MESAEQELHSGKAFTSRPQFNYILIALAAAMCVLLWQGLTVRYSYGGNWTGLFCTGGLQITPPELRSENIYRFPDSYGYDGQFYHYMAHDPVFTRGLQQYIDAPRFRYRRILVPALAYLLALGRDAWIDWAYIGLVALSVFLGSYWLSKLLPQLGYSPLWGATFAVVPAVLVSVDRLTVDSLLAALCVGYVLYVRRNQGFAVFLILAAAVLTRESGVLLAGGYALYLLLLRQFRRAILYATSILPALCWYVFVNRNTSPFNDEIVSLSLLSGYIQRLFHPYPYPLGGPIRAIATAFDYVALTAIPGALAWAAYRTMRRAWTPLTVPIYLFTGLTIALSVPGAWTEVYAFGRTLTPLVLLVAIDGLTARSWIAVLPLAALDPRIVLQFGRQILSVLRGLFAIQTHL